MGSGRAFHFLGLLSACYDYHQHQNKATSLFPFLSLVLSFGRGNNVRRYLDDVCTLLRN